MYINRKRDRGNDNKVRFIFPLFPDLRRSPRESLGTLFQGPGLVPDVPRMKYQIKGGSKGLIR